jgi:lysophospholipase L1-like esterase
LVILNRAWARVAISLVIAAGLIVLFESHHAIPAFRTWTLFAVFAFFVSGVVWTRGLAQNVLLVGASVALCFAALEGVCAAIEPKGAAGIATTITPGWSRNSKVTGWEPANPGSVIHATKVDAKTGEVIYDAHYTIDESRDRVTKSAPSGPSVAFFGDSFTYGEGVEDGQTMPQQFADLLRGEQRTVNLALSGYSPQQFLREVETGYKDDVIGKSPAAFVFLTSAFHAARTACKETWVATAPRYKLVNDKVAWAGTCEGNLWGTVQHWLQNSAGYRRFLQPLQSRLTHDDVALYIRILARATQLSQERYGVQTLVPYISPAPEYLNGTGYTDAQVMEELRGHGVAVVDMNLPDDPAKRTSIPRDGHPTPYAQAVRAKMIADKLRDMGVALNGAQAE